MLTRAKVDRSTILAGNSGEEWRADRVSVWRSDGSKGSSSVTFRGSEQTVGPAHAGRPCCTLAETRTILQVGFWFVRPADLDSIESSDSLSRLESSDRVSGASQRQQGAE